MTFIDNHDIDIFAINETKLTDKTKFFISGLTTIRCDNPSSRSGGVAVLIKSNIPYEQIPTPPLNFQAIAIRISKIVLVFAYIPPQHKLLAAELSSIFSLNEAVAIIGDLNCKNEEWNNHMANPNGNLLKSYCDSHDLAVSFPSSHTRPSINNCHPSTLDIAVLKNIPQYINTFTVHALDSDHYPILFSLAINSPKLPPKTFRDFKHTNWTTFASYLNANLTIKSQISTPEQLNDVCQSFTSLIQKAINKSTPLRLIKHHKNPLPPNILSLINLRNKARKIAQKNPNPANIRIYKDLREQVKTAININSNRNWNSFLSSLNPQGSNLWRVTKRMKGTHEKIGNLTDDKGNHLSHDKLKADLLAANFAKAHILPPADNCNLNKFTSLALKESLDAPPSIVPYEDLITMADLRKEIKKLKKRKAPGNDGIPNSIIKALPRKALCQLLYIINNIIKLGYFPNCWKNAIVIPIPKPGKPNTCPSSYRPISLLPTLSKLAERLILPILSKYIHSASLIPDFQFGFRKGHGAHGQLARVLTDIVEGFNYRQSTVAAFFDIEKAFDRVWHAGLIWKLKKHGFPLHVTKLVANYLNGRSFQVRLGNFTSKKQHLPAGVPQGSVLGPVLFNTYISDLPTLDTTKIAQFADDTAIYSTHRNPQTAAGKVQQHATAFAQYCKTWRISLNKSKTELIVFSRNTIHNYLQNPFLVDNVEIAPAESVKYLGVKLDRKLDLKYHIQSAVCKANSILSKLHPLLNKKSPLSTKTKVQLYKTIIRPTLTYAAPVIGLASDKTINKLQIMQNKCLRLITNLHYDGRKMPSNQTIHDKAKVEQIIEFINKLSNNYYHNNIYNSQLTENLTKTHNKIIKKRRRVIYKLPYHRLTINNTLLDDDSH